MHLKRLLSAFVFFTVIASCGAQRRSAAGRRLRPRTAQQSTRRLTALHVGYVLGRLAEEGRFPELHVSITSLLFHASCPIHLHFATDNQSEAFLTAALPNMPAQLGFKHQVDWKFVDGHAVMGATMQAVQQTRAGSQFYHAFAHYKVSPEKLFPGVDRMLLLDFDTLVISDMCTVSNGVFAEMHSQQTLLAMAAEMHPTYVPGAEYHFLTYLLPAHLKWATPLGFQDDWEGLNAGVIFADLAAMRAWQWTDRWLAGINLPQFADKPNLLLWPEQNIINLMARMYPAIMLPLHSGFNFQLLSWEAQSWARPEQLRHIFLAHVNEVHILHGQSGAWHGSRDDSELGAIWWLFTDLADLSEVYVKNPKYAAGQAVIMSSAERATAMRAVRKRIEAAVRRSLHEHRIVAAR